jgi:hypothetical protein
MTPLDESDLEPIQGIQATSTYRTYLPQSQPVPLRLGVGHCNSCDCEAFDDQGGNSLVCLCGHSFSNHSP